MIYVTGDIHGQFNSLLYILENGDYSGSSVFIAGDIGLGFHEFDHDLETLGSVEKRLKKIDVHFYLVRGNHDIPGYWSRTNKPRALNNFPHIHFVVDYKVVELEGHKIACVGGATSVDRYQRTRNIDWWEQECVIDYKYLTKIKGIDTVITHAAPIFCPPGDHDIKKVSYDILCRSREDREILKRLYFDLIQETKVTNWFYGHYHKKYETWMSNDIANYSSLDIKLASTFPEPTGEDECRFRGLADLRGTTIDIESL
jgi:DNA repair exonuclease SbcCD nuclease subunit